MHCYAYHVPLSTPRTVKYATVLTWVPIPYEKYLSSPFSKSIICYAVMPSATVLFRSSICRSWYSHNHVCPISRLLKTLGTKALFLLLSQIKAFMRISIICFFKNILLLNQP